MERSVYSPGSKWRSLWAGHGSMSLIRTCVSASNKLRLQYPEQKGIPIDRIDTHSLRSGGANALLLAGFSDREIQKMGWWRSATFKEYIREELACFSEGMSTKMKQRFAFVNIGGGVYTDITDQVLPLPYMTPFAVAA